MRRPVAAAPLLLCLTIFLTVRSGSAFTALTFVPTSRHHQQQRLSSSPLATAGTSTAQLLQPGQATELPDSLEDAAVRAAEASAAFCEQGGNRCRVDFDTSIGDETFTLLKTSTEFMQNYVTALTYAVIPGLQEQRQKEMMAVAQARAELKALEEESGDNDDDNGKEIDADKKDALVQLIARDGRSADEPWQGPKARVYFPDEGSAALARRDWTDKVPACVQFSSCGGVQVQDVSNDRLVFFFCPRASESDSVEAILQRTEELAADPFTVFINPILVDMGVTGFGMAGRM